VSVLVVVSAPHRVDALQATSWLIDALKARVPIWKKEVYDDGDSRWKANSECCFHAASTSTATHDHARSSDTPVTHKH